MLSIYLGRFTQRQHLSMLVLPERQYLCRFYQRDNIYMFTWQSSLFIFISRQTMNVTVRSFASPCSWIYTCTVAYERTCALSASVFACEYLWKSEHLISGFSRLSFPQSTDIYSQCFDLQCIQHLLTRRILRKFNKIEIPPSWKYKWSRSLD